MSSRNNGIKKWFPSRDFGPGGFSQADTKNYKKLLRNPDVIPHPIEHPAHIQASMTLPTRPHVIFSTLQGTQNPDTKPTLQTAKNANAQPTHPG